MALKPCVECKREVSTEAKTCPHCGTPKPASPKLSIKRAVAGLLLLALIVAVVASRFSAGDAANTKASTDSPTSTDKLVSSTPIAAKTLKMTPVAYAARLNKEFESAGVKWRVPSKPDVLDGAVNNVMQVKLDDHIFINGGVDKSSGELIAITIVGAGDGSAKSGAKILLTVILGLRVAVDKSDATDVAKVVQAFLEDPAASDSAVTRDLGQVKLWHRRSKELGAWFGAEAN